MHDITPTASTNSHQAPAPAPASPTPHKIERPRLVLRVALAGSCKLPKDGTKVEESLKMVVRTLASVLAEIAPGREHAEKSRESSAAEFYSTDKPLLRLVTGLAEGADELGCKVVGHKDSPGSAQIADVTGGRVETELAAVIPFELADYRRSRSKDFRERFEELAQACRYIHVLDGKYEKVDFHDPQHPTEDELARDRFPSIRRGRAYRAQGAVLLRHGDLLVAIADPEVAGKTGGTLETARAALGFQLPVVFVHAQTGGVWLLEPGQDLFGRLEEGPFDDWQRRLGQVVREIVVGSAEQPPETIGDAPPTVATSSTVDHHAKQMLDELFDEQTGKASRWPGREIIGLRPIWKEFEDQFRPSESSAESVRMKLEPFAGAREAVSKFNGRYTSWYRGAFLMNYQLAILAVALAALALTLRATTEHGAFWQGPVFLLMGFCELIAVTLIYSNTHRANHHGWNDKAVDSRYVAERLRTMFYLSLAGSFRPPVVAPVRSDNRAMRQSAANWLFDAIVRSVRPDDVRRIVERAGSRKQWTREIFPLAKTEEFELLNGETARLTILRTDPLVALEEVRKRWLESQFDYHWRNALTMQNLGAWGEQQCASLSRVVIGCVGIDVALHAAKLFGWLPHELAEWLHEQTPWLLLLSAVLPAAVASFNGIRFQSECSRLAERSRVMQSILLGPHPRRVLGRRLSLQEEKQVRNDGFRKEVEALEAKIERARREPATDPAAWSADVLRLVETIAEDLVREVAEWSVLYAKEIPEA